MRRTPVARMLSTCWRNEGWRCTGSTSCRNVCRGSAPEMTAVASIRSPVASTTARAPLSSISMLATRAVRRISAPAPVAATASAADRAPGPPDTTVSAPVGCPSCAVCNSHDAVVPADRGPACMPNTPRAQMAARSAGVSNHSAARSPMGIGPQRSRSYRPWRPSPRSFRPVCSSSHSSPGDGVSIDGGTCPSTAPIAAVSACVLATKAGHRSASRGDHDASARAAAPVSRGSTSVRPSRAGTHTDTAGRMTVQALRVQAEVARHISAQARPYASARARARRVRARA